MAEEQLLTTTEPCGKSPVVAVKELELTEGVQEIAVIGIEEDRGDGLLRRIGPENLEEGSEAAPVPGIEEQLLAEEVEIVLLAGQTTVVLDPALPAELAAEVRDDLLDGRHRNPLDEVEGIDGGVIRLVQVAEVALVER